MKTRASELYGIPIKDIAALCGVDISTARRWKRGATCPPPAALRLLTRNLGIFDPAWDGWIVKDGCLYSPEHWEIPRGHVLSVPLMRAQLKGLQDEVATLRLRYDLDKLPIHVEQPKPEDENYLPAWAIGL